MKKIFIIVIIFFVFCVQSSQADILDELSSVSEKSDIFMYFNMEETITFLKKKGIDIKEVDEIVSEDAGKNENKALTDFGLKLSDIKEILFAGCIEDFEKKGGFLLFVTVHKNKAKIPDNLKLKSLKINGTSFYEIEAKPGVLFSSINNTFIAGSKEYIEGYFTRKKTKIDILSNSAVQFKKNSTGSIIYVNISVSDYLKKEMDKAYSQGILFAKGIKDNVFINTLLNLKSVDYGIQIKDTIHFFAGMQGTTAIDSERLIMLTHFAIVGTSLAASFADMIAARSQDDTLGKVTENNEILSSLQHIIGRMKVKPIDNGVTVSFFMTEKETDSFIAFVKKSIDDEKKAKIERKQSEKISIITKALTDKDNSKAEMLLNEKIDINRKDIDGNTILSTAALMGNIKIAAMALSKGAYIELKNPEGLTPLHYAAKGGNVEMVKFLLSKGADVSAKNENDMTPLHYNCQQGNHEITKIFLIAGAEINTLAMDGVTPAHLASEEGYIDIIKVLADKDADFNIRDANGERCVDVAYRNGHSALVEFFKSKYNLEPSPVENESYDYDKNSEGEFDSENSGEDDHNYSE